MKKLYFILALVVVSFLMVFAGDTIKILRIYHNGSFTAIPLENVDSVGHSKNNETSIIEAIDSTYNFSINKIDSVAITEANKIEYKLYLEAIKEQLIIQDGLPFDTYQKKLFEWFNNCEFISKSTLNDLRNTITIEFSNGMDFFINFVDIPSTDSYTLSLNTRSGNNDNNEEKEEVKYINVSEQKQPKETIIEEPDILYIQGQSMTSINEEKTKSNAIKEHEELVGIINNSPVETNIKLYSKTISFFNENFSKYGLIIISQCHGDNARRGLFQIQDGDYWWDVFNKKGKLGVIVYRDGQEFCRTDIGKDNWLLLSIHPKYFANKVSSNNIIYGSFCYSYDLYKEGFTSNNAKDATFYGYNSKITYRWEEETPAKDSLIARVTKLMNGCMFNQAFYFDQYYAPDFIVPIPSNKHLPVSNKQLSCQRFFSIKTEDITDNNEIKGQIKGYKNLKTEHNPNRKNKNDIIKKWILFAHEGKEEFKPEDNNVKRIEDAYKPDKDGNFTISSDIVNQYPDHAFIVGFEYAGKVYYGEPKWIKDFGVIIDEIDYVAGGQNLPSLSITGRITGYKKEMSSNIICNIFAKEGDCEIVPQEIVLEQENGWARHWGNGGISCGYPTYLINKLNTVYSFAIGIEYQGKIYYSKTQKFMFKLDCPNKDAKHPHIIDLGLSNGTKWACCNLGASSPNGYGDYYAWGETETKTIDFFNAANYEHYDKGKKAFKNIGEDISGTQYDAAHANKSWSNGRSWVMPTSDDFTKLVCECSFFWASLDGVNGLYLKGPSGNAIFLPAASHMYMSSSGYNIYDWESYYNYLGIGAYYWSSNSCKSPGIASALWFAYQSYLDFNHLSDVLRYNGLSVRPVNK